MKKLLASRLIATAVLIAPVLVAHAEAPFSFAATPGKLPKDVVPVQYAAHLVPDIAAATFLGSQTVEIDVLKTTSTIMLNAVNLEIDAASLSGKGVETKLTPILDKAQQTLTFKLEQPLAPGRYQLALKFHGVIGREARGAFYLPYKVGSVDKRMIATQMEPSDARRLLPLWDEPAFRANFKLTVDVPATFKAFSNMPVAKQETIEGGLQRYSFGMTPKMPSYLLVLVAGELERTSARQDGVDIGVVTTAGKQPAAAYALSSTKDLLRYFNKYFAQPYPLPKLDQIAIPGGFNGAMENWGGIVYNESALLYDPKTSPESVKQTSFGINAHEVAHQWFGNLVTMAWWDNLWLNEGFASWMATKAEQHFYPEWRPQLAALAEREAVMNLDARKSTHPIQTPVLTEEQAANAFDSITYIKGQSFLRMLEAYLGEDQFRKGMRAYMAKHQYSNTTTADLWAALEKASGKPVARLASDWTNQPGFPLLRVSQVCENGKRRVTIAQEQYRIDEPATEARLWNVPVQLGTVGGKSAYTLLATPHTTVVQPNCEGALVADPESVGYFRVQYDSATFEALAAQVPKLNDTTRLRLLNDTWSMAQAGRMKLDQYLQLVGKYGAEPRLAIWDAITANYRSLDKLTQGEPEQAKIRAHLIGLVSPRVDQLGWTEKDGESGEERQLRAMLAGALAQSGDAGAIAQGRAMLERYLVDPANVPVSMLNFAIQTGARHADLATYDKIAERIGQTQDTQERNRLGRALSGARDPALGARTLRMAVSPGIPANITGTLVTEVASVHQAQAWEFAVANKDKLLGDQDAISRNIFLPGLFANSYSAADADLLEAYVARAFGPDAQDAAKRAANGIRTRAAQKQRLLPQLRAALK